MCLQITVKKPKKTFETVDFIPSGLDERWCCSPSVNLPVGSLMRSMYATYPRYHTSLDDKSLIFFYRLKEGILIYLMTLEAIESNVTNKATIAHCEPMLVPRGL